jgi:Zn-dependent protease with chaperone function
MSLSDDEIKKSDYSAFSGVGNLSGGYNRIELLGDNHRPGLCHDVAEMAKNIGMDKVPLLYCKESEELEMLVNPQTGSIAISYGLLQQPDVSNKELVAGIAHEIGHEKMPVNGHIATALKIAAIATPVLGGIGTLGALATGNLPVAALVFQATLATTAMEAAGSASFSRRSEMDADRFAGYATGDPQSLIQLHEKHDTAQQMQSGVMGGLSKIFGSHPQTAVRNFQLREIAANLTQDGQPIDPAQVPKVLRPKI